MGKSHSFNPTNEDEETAPAETEDANIRASRARAGSPFLNNGQAAFYVGLHWRTLENMRARGEGPRWRKHGRYVRYHIDDLDHWSRSNGKGGRKDTPTGGENA